MNKINEKLNACSYLKLLTRLLVIGLFVVSHTKAADKSEEVKKAMTKLLANGLVMEKTVQSNFNPDLWQKSKQLRSSVDLAPSETIERIRSQLINAGIMESQPALAPSSAATFANSGYLAKKTDKRIERIKQAINSHTIDVRVRESSNSVTQLKGKLLSRSELPATRYAQSFSFQAHSREEQDKMLGREFLKVYKGVLQVDNPDQEFKLVRRKEDIHKRCHLRYSQIYRGLPVWPAELMVYLDPEGNVDLMSGTYIPTPEEVVIRPSITVEEAIDFALETLSEAQETDVSAPILIIYAPIDQAPRLAWKMEVEVNLLSSWLVVVDAHKGVILDAYKQGMDFNVNGSGEDLLGISRPLSIWQENNLFYMVDTSKSMFDPSFNPLQDSSSKGAIIIADARYAASTDNHPLLSYITSENKNFGWFPADAVSAAYGLSETYDYYLDRHLRDSWDGEGGDVIGVVRVGNDNDKPEDRVNAAWAGTGGILFGTKFPWAGAIDVVAHEFTHGVIQATAGLLYQNQSGALNEAFSDIFGEMAEARTKGGNPDWLKGGVGGVPLIQNYKKPAFVLCRGNPCPSKMSEYLDLPKTEDHGGVHSNSSIINHAFYLLAEGLPEAIGIRDAEQIFYQAMIHLGQQSQFVDARRMAIVWAEELFGADSIQVKKTIEAFERVEIFDNTATPTPDARPETEALDSTLAIAWGVGFSDVDTFELGYFIHRRELDYNDSEKFSSPLFPIEVKRRRLSVSGDGSEVAFVSADNDFCIYQTDNSQKGFCLGYLGRVYSGTMSPDGQRFAFILLNEQGETDSTIVLVDLNGPTQTIKLRAPLLDGGAIEVFKADEMDFSSDGSMLIYDAFNQIQDENSSKIGVWSIYGLDLNTGIISSIVPPSSKGDTGNPSFSQTRDHLITFEAVHNDHIGFIAIGIKNLINGEYGLVNAVESPLFHKIAPTFTGDDSAIVYSSPNPSQSYDLTGFSLFRQPLADNSISPKGDSSLWLEDASLGVIYRRGDFNLQESFRLNVSLTGNASGLVSSSPSGINCGGDCSEDYIEDTEVSLVANPTSVGTVFLGWSGACSGTGSCKVTVNANKSVTANFSLKAVPPASNDIFGNSRLFAEQQYRDFLHREGDAGGIEYWRKEIDEGRLSRAEVVNNFLSSNEFAGQIAPIVRLYFAYFGRIPDFQGLNYWLDKSQNGMSLRSISESFIQSNEFKATYGQLSNAGFVTLVYQNVLRRDPDIGGFNYWMAKLENGKSRGGIMAGFSESAEYRSKMATSVSVTMVYAGMLQRSPDHSGFNYWVDRIGNSGSLALVETINGFLDSLEYRNRF